MTESNDSGGRFGILLKITTQIIAPLSVDLLSCIVTNQAQLVIFPAVSVISTDSRDFLLQSLSLQSLSPPRSCSPDVILCG